MRTALAAGGRDPERAIHARPPGGERVSSDDVDVGAELRTERAGDAASKVAAVPEVRSGIARSGSAILRSPRASSPTAATWAPLFSRDAILKVVSDGQRRGARDETS